MEIRNAEGRDVPRILEIERASFSHPWSEAAFLGELGREDCLFLAAEEEGEVLGFAILMLLGDGEEGEIYNIAVDARCRRRGAGYALLSALLYLAERRGMVSCTLEARVSNLPAVKLYEKCGFRTVAVRKNYYDTPAEDALLMLRETKGERAPC